LSLKSVEEQLVSFGLSRKETMIYLYLLANGPREVSDISHGLNIAKADIYKYVDELEGKGICREILTHPSKFEASPLSEALDSLILKQDERIESLTKAKDEIVAVVGGISPPTVEPKFQILQGREPTTNKIWRIRRSAYDVIIYVREKTLSFLHTLGMLDVRRISKGLSIRILTKFTAKTIPIVEEYRHCKFRDIREQSDASLPEFAVFDKKEALIALSASTKSAIIDKDELAMWTDNEATIMLIVTLFEKMWAEATEPQ
jgi:sugar-specific transcriptional regulator TrmB